jgi:hypothetical protein
MAHSPVPKAGDVIFICSGGKDAFFNVWMQRHQFDPGRTNGPWFSHVAIALDSQLAMEASTPPGKDDPLPWSGSRLEGGVRLIPIPDLLLGAKRWQVLRSPKAAVLPKDALDIRQLYVSGIHGSKYSIKLFEDYVREAAPFLAFLSDASGLSEGWTSEATDPAHKIGEEFRARVLKDMPRHKFKLQESTYYCSDLVRVLLSKVDLIGQQDRTIRISPSALFDVLKGGGFEDVTEQDYSLAAVNAIPQENQATSVRDHFLATTAQIKFFAGDHGFNDLWDVLDEKVAAFNQSLENTQDKLFRMMGIPPISRPESK